MKRNIILLLLFVLAVGGSLMAAEKATLKVKAATANVRSGPDASAAIIAKVAMDTIMEVFGKEGAWYAVSVKDESGKEVTGYIHKTVVEVTGEVEEAAVKPGPDAPMEDPVARPVKKYASGGLKLMGGLSLGNGTFSETLPVDIKKTNRKSFMGGLGFESGGMFAFETDLLYSPGGAVVTATNPADPTEWFKFTIVADAVTMPVMIKVRFLRGMTPYILAGGEVGYVLSAKLKMLGSDGSTDEVDMTDDFNRFIYGVVFGGGFEMPLGGMNLLLECRYRLGLSNLIKEADPGEYMKPTALTFFLGIRF
jgi:hypothetical protein